jgi:uncharacterized protein
VLIQIDKLKRRPRQIVIDEQASDFAVLHELVEDGTVFFNDKINGTLEATWAGDIIEVNGRLTTTVTSPCGRCLMPVTEQLGIPVLLSYAGRGVEGDVAVAEDVELTDLELGLIPYSGPEIDLRPDLEQEIIMALPQQTLCEEACKGLCPVCGCNLNQESCECAPPVFHAGLEALKNFKSKK